MKVWNDGEENASFIFFVTMAVVGAVAYLGESPTATILRTSFMCVSGMLFLAVVVRSIATHSLIRGSEQVFSLSREFRFTTSILPVVFECIVGYWAVSLAIANFFTPRVSQDRLVFYCLSLIWSVFQTVNIEKDEKWHLLPRCLATICGAYLFIKYGLFPALLGRLLIVTLTMVPYKMEAVLRKDLRSCAYSLGLVLIGLGVLFYRRRDLLEVFQISYGYAADSLIPWKLVDYMALSVVVFYTTKVFFTGYDQGILHNDGVTLPTWGELAGGFGLIGAAAVGLFGLMEMSQLSIGARALVLTLCYCSLQDCRTGSGLVRMFWTTFVTLAVGLQCVSAIGLVLAPLFVGSHVLLRLPIWVMERENE